MRDNSSFQLIGATLPRTGTMTLKAALSKMGLGNSFHMYELFQRPNYLPHKSFPHKNTQKDFIKRNR